MDQVLEFLHSHYYRALESLPVPVADNLKLVIRGQRLDILSLIVVSAVLAIYVLSNLSSILVKKKKNLPPSIPGGWPVLGNILQLREAKPHRTFTAWAAKHGPIFHFKTGSINNVVITSAELAKEVMVTKFSSISTRRLSTALQIVSSNKTMVALSDYGEEHHLLKKWMVGHLLSPHTQKANRPLREQALSVLDEMFELLEGKKSEVLDVRDFTKRALFPFAMQQIFGYSPDVPELGRYVHKWEIFDALVISIFRSAINVDWRNFFPALKFIPNTSMENAVHAVVDKKTAIMDALIAEQRKLIKTRARLYKEIKSVVGNRMVTEDDLDKFPLLTAIIQETFRVHAPVSILPPRYVEEDITIGGYDIPKGWEVIINAYGIHMDPKVWSNPEKWDPDRLVNDKLVDLGFKDFRILPFGGGKRRCAGIQQALHIISMIIASFVLHFDWTLPPADSKDKAMKSEDTSFLTTHKLHPLKAVAKPRVNGRIGA